MTDKEYTDVLGYLLTQLKEKQALEVANDISRQISRGKTITKDSTDLKEKNIKQSGVGKTQTLPFTPKEALEIAILYLEKLMLDVPGYGEKIGIVFGNNVLWNYDQFESANSLSENEKFMLSNLKFDGGEIEQAKKELNKLKEYMNE